MSVPGKMATYEASIYHKIDAAWLIIHIYRNTYRGPSRRLALHAAARTITAAETVFNRIGTIEEWRQAYWAELGARAAATAISRGFGHFRG
jgi:hypothetical protein